MTPRSVVVVVVISVVDFVFFIFSLRAFGRYACVLCAALLH